jgi:hypothetical protein
MKKKAKINVQSQGKVLFKGKLMDIPMKDEAIIKRSIEVFDDDDPCIIHRSFVVKQFADELEGVLANLSLPITVEKLKTEVDFLELPSDATIEWV